MTREEAERRLEEMERAEDERDADGSVTFGGDPLWHEFAKALADEALAAALKMRRRGHRSKPRRLCP